MAGADGAPSYGSIGGLPLAKPIVAIVPTASGQLGADLVVLAGEVDDRAGVLADRAHHDTESIHIGRVSVRSRT